MKKDIFITAVVLACCYALGWTVQTRFNVSMFIMIIIIFIISLLILKLKQKKTVNEEREEEKARVKMIRAISHDLRTLLTTIYGSSSALLENGDCFTSEQKINMLQRIQQDSLSLFRMIDNMICIIKIDNGSIKINKIPTLIDELVDSVIIKFYKRYPNQKVIIDIPEDFATVPMDAPFIEQAIINILENAVQHSEGMDKLILRIKINSDKAVFEIEDNGCGIPDDKIKNIFNGIGYKYMETSDCTTNSVGIGLSVCAAIIRIHGGEITASNLSDGGIVFRFTLNMEDKS